MQRIRIGIIDEEKEYVKNLTSYLQRYGMDKWELVAFTSEEALRSYLQKSTLDILGGTNRRMLMQLGKEKACAQLWLSNEKDHTKETEIASVYRYQSAEKIGHCLEGIVRQKFVEIQTDKPIVAMYSPIGRCGKTLMALDVVKSGRYGKWLYVGMEDYSSFRMQKDSSNQISDDILYYWKERQEERFVKLIEQMQNIIPSGSSFLDTKQIESNDIEWLKGILQTLDYKGVILDMGSGVLQNFRMFQFCDCLLVPYIQEEVADIKKENFEHLFELYEM